MLFRRMFGDTIVAGITGNSSKMGDFECDKIEQHLGKNIVIGGGDILRDDTKSLKDHYKVKDWPTCLTHTFALPNAAYVSCGVPFPLRFTLPYKFMWVRDHLSAKNIGVPAIVAPDICTLVSDYFPFRGNGDYVVVQFINYNHNIAKMLANLRGEKIVLVSGQRYANDHVDLQLVAKSLGLEFVQPDVSGILSLIAGSKLVVSTSLHFSICAFSYGVPFAMIPLTKTDKQAAFLEMIKAPGLFISSDISQMLAYRADAELAKDMTRKAVESLYAKIQ